MPLSKIIAEIARPHFEILDVASEKYLTWCIDVQI